jgi:hypothetical protein
VWFVVVRSMASNILVESAVLGYISSCVWFVVC